MLGSDQIEEFINFVSMIKIILDNLLKVQLLLDYVTVYVTVQPISRVLYQRINLPCEYEFRFPLLLLNQFLKHFNTPRMIKNSLHFRNGQLIACAKGLFALKRRLFHF